MRSRSAENKGKFSSDHSFLSDYERGRSSNPIIRLNDNQISEQPFIPDIYTSFSYWYVEKQMGLRSILFPKQYYFLNSARDLIFMRDSKAYQEPNEYLTEAMI